MNEIHEANREHWDSMAPEWQEMRDQDQLWRKCIEQPELALGAGMLDLVREFAGPVAGKRICMIGSGDNCAAFALASMGAVVTSTDISEQQIGIAARRAEILGLRITFIRADAADLSPVGEAEFDLVCSTNGFFVWIADLGRVFSSVHRVLKPGGHYISYDIHPFQRPWKDPTGPLRMAKPYFETGPFPRSEQSGVVYNFTWTVSGIVNPLLASGLVLRRMLESPARDSRFWKDGLTLPGTDESLQDWRNNPRAGLPAWLTLASQKPHREG